MTVKPYPSNIIIFNVDDRVLDKDMNRALKRSWTHIGEVLVRSHTGDEGENPSNFIHVMVKFGTRSYLCGNNDDSDANWSERIEQHLLSTMRKISNNVIAFNRRQRKCGDAELSIDYIEFELEAGTLTLEYRLDSNGYLPTICAHFATDIRSALNAGVLGEPCRMRIPSARSYQEQVCLWTEARTASETPEEAEQSIRFDSEQETYQLSETQAGEQFIESPDLVAEVAQEEAAKAKEVSPFEIAPLTEEEWEAEYGILDADFTIDYHIWEAIYPDGSSREFDSQSSMFIS